MIYYGVITFTKQKLYLLIASSLLITAVSYLNLIWNISLYTVFGLIILAPLLYLDLVIAEKKSSATLSAFEFRFHRAFLFGIINIKRVYTFQYSSFNQETLDEIDRMEAQTFSSDTLNELTQANIIFYRNTGDLSEYDA